jgi:hypothetical protein
VKCPFFTTEKLRVEGTVLVKASMIVLLDGKLSIDGQSAKAGEVWYAQNEDAIEMTGQATVLLTR